MLGHDKGIWHQHNDMPKLLQNVAASVEWSISFFTKFGFTTYDKYQVAPRLLATWVDGVDWYLEPKAHRGSAQRLPHKILSTHLTMRIPLLPRTQEERDSRVVARKNEVVVK